MEAILRDLRYSLRRLLRAPGFTAVAILTLALGIGATTAIFTIVDSVLLTPLPFAEPQRLTMIQNTAGARLSPAYLHDWRLQNRTFDDIAGWRDVRANLTGRGEPIEVLADSATTNFFAVLGVPALLGRTFTTDMDLRRAEPEVVLSYGLWQRLYGGDRNVVGQPITLDGEVYTIVGVMPAVFTIRTTELAESRAELWMPLPLVPDDWTGMGGSLHVVSRLRPEVTSDQAEEDLSLIARRIEEQYPSYSRDWGVAAVPLLDATVRDVRLTLFVLFGAVGILLVVACVNVANLVLSRVAVRRAELAVRLSLGATGGRLLRQLLTESLVLAMAGGVLGVLLAVWGTELLVSALPTGLGLPRTGEIAVDVRILAFASTVTVAAAMLFGVLPAFSAARSSSYLALRRANGSSPGATRNPIGSTLIVSEVALTLVLLAGAGLLGRSLWELSVVDPGFRPEQVLTMRTTLPPSRYDTDEKVRAFGNLLLQRIASLPGVSSAGFANYLPLSNFGVAERFEIEGRPEARIEDQKFSWVGVVGGEYFEAMGIPLLRGRLPTVADTEAGEPVFVVDEELARLYWPDGDPIGAHLTWHGGPEGRFSGQIVGVVGNVRWQTMAADPPASAYWWFPHAPGRDVTIVVRTPGEPVAMAGLISARVREIDPNQPVADIRTMNEFISADLARSRVTMLILGSFAAAALLLAALGLYGVIALAVTQRTGEIGVRVALGAQRRDVYRLVMQQGALLLGAGLLLGMLAALALGRLIAGLVYGITPSDPPTLLTVTIFLMLVAAIATYLPARRAARVDPLVALRAE